MTDIEQYRAGFEAARKPRTDLARKGDRYNNPVVQACWETWIAAKRDTSTELDAMRANLETAVKEAWEANAKLSALSSTSTSQGALTDNEIECMWHEACLKHLDMDDSAIPDFARAVEAEVIARCRAEGGNTCNDGSGQNTRELPETRMDSGFEVLGNSGAAQGDALDAARVVQLAKTLIENHGKTISNMYCNGEPIGRELISAIAASTTKGDEP